MVDIAACNAVACVDTAACNGYAADDTGYIVVDMVDIVVDNVESAACNGPCGGRVDI